MYHELIFWGTWGLGGTKTAYKSVTGKPEMQNFAATKSYAEQLRDWY